MTADSSARKSEVPPIVSASDRDPFASNLELSTFISRAISLRVSSPGLRRAYSRAYALGVARADTERVDPELCGSCGDASVVLAVPEKSFVLLRGDVSVLFTRCAGEIFVGRAWNTYLWCLLFVDSLACFRPAGPPGPCLLRYLL